MARAREFDEKVAVQRAMQLFWRKGYEAATLPALLKAMRLSRGSFYNAFGTKREVMLRAIQCYMESGMDGILTPLGTPNAGRAEIEQAFARLVDYTSSPQGRQGCLVVNSLSSGAMQDAKIREALTTARSRSEDILTHIVATGQAAGTITNRDDPRTIGRYLLSNISGLMISCKTTPGRAALEDIARSALRILD